MKAVNTAWRKAGKPSADDVSGWQKVAELVGVSLDELGPVRVATRQSCHASAPYESYELSNRGSEIRRIRERISELQSTAQAEPSGVDHGFCRVVENTDINRIQLIFPGKPEEYIRTTLKQNGFRWARTERAWQRHLNDAGRRAARWVVDQLRKGRESGGQSDT